MRVSCLDCVNLEWLPFGGKACAAGKTKSFDFWLAMQLQHKMITCDFFREETKLRWQCWTSDYTCVYEGGKCINPYHDGELVPEGL